MAQEVLKRVKNIFLNTVEERKISSGIKRVLIRNGEEFVEKENSSPLLFCRIKSKKDYRILVKNIFNEEFLKSFNYSIQDIYSFFFGKSVSEDKTSYHSFLENVKKAKVFILQETLGKRINKSYSHIDWKKWVFSDVKNSSGFLMDTQIGLNQLLTSKKSEIIEIVPNDNDSALYGLTNKQIFAFSKSKKSYIPFSLKTSMDNLYSNLKENDKSSLGQKNFLLRDLIEESLQTEEAQILDIKKTKLIWDCDLFNDWFYKKIQKLILNKHKVIFVVKKSKKDLFLNNDFLQKLKDEGCSYHVKNIQEEDSVLFFNSKLNQEEISVDLFSKPIWSKTLLSEINQGEREFYEPISKVSPPTAMISSKIAVEVKNALKQINQEHNSIDSWIARLLKIKQEDLGVRLSSEQVDAVALGVSSLLKNKGLIIADETGFGKGRILAAISIIGQLLGKTVFFFTENKQLFSDFYRDIVAVKEEQKFIPLILNKSAKIFDPDGNLVVKNHTDKSFKDMIDNKKKWEKDENRFLITNYAQINRAGVKQPKIKFLDRLMGDNCWIILDESHNSSGDSNVNSNLKHLIKKAEGVVFSSATYAKTEEKLSIYEKALPLSNVAKQLITLALFGDDGDLRELLTKEMAKNGVFIRREHPPIDLPEVIYIDSPKIQEQLSLFCDMWNKIFEFVEVREKMLGYFSAKAWLTLGSYLSRSIREFSFCAKVEQIAEMIEEKIKQNEKVVLVTEMTLESALRDLVENENLLNVEDNEDDFKPLLEDKIEKPKERVFTEKPNWSWKWISLVEKLSNEEELSKILYKRKKDQNFNIENYDNLKPHWLNMKAKLLEIIKENNYFSLSPLDELKALLKDKGIDFDELSGRRYQLNRLKNGQWVVDNKLFKRERTEIVNNFNSGKLDVLLVTKAGASGISLHAGEKFKDQRVRNLWEWDISSNSANRIQFLGRVRRKDQVVEPNFRTLLLNTPADIRKLEIEKRKQVRLSAHTGGRKENEVLDWLSEEGELIVEEWSRERKNWAKRIGAFNANVSDETKRIDRALARATILPVEEQEFLFNRIEKGIEAHTEYHFYKKQIPVSCSIDEEFWWGNEESKTETEFNNSIMNLGEITKNIRLWELDYSKNDKIKIIEANNKAEVEIYDNKGKEELFLNNWKNQKEENVYLNKLFNQFKIGSVFNFDFKNLYLKTGVLLDIIWEHDDMSLNTTLLKVLFENEEKAIHIPLIYFLKNTGFKVLTTSFHNRLLVNNEKKQYFYSNTLEGNPILLSVWNKKTGIGKIEVIFDKEEGYKSVLILPKNSIDLEGLDIPFVNLKQIDDFISQNEDVFLYNSPFREKEKVVLYYEKNKNGIKMQGRAVILMREKDYEYMKNTWLVKAKQFLEKIEESVPEKGEEKVIKLTFYYTKFYQLLSLLQEERIFFFLPKEYKKWFNENIHKYIQSV